MKVYLKTLEDWVSFVYGEKVVAFKNPLETYCKCILVGFSEVISEDEKTVVIVKRY